MEPLVAWMAACMSTRLLNSTKPTPLGRPSGAIISFTLRTPPYRSNASFSVRFVMERGRCLMNTCVSDVEGQECGREHGARTQKDKAKKKNKTLAARTYPSRRARWKLAACAGSAAGGQQEGQVGKGKDGDEGRGHDELLAARGVTQ